MAPGGVCESLFSYWADAPFHLSTAPSTGFTLYKETQGSDSVRDPLKETKGARLIHT